MLTGRTITVIGAGIAGLAVARALAMKGSKVRVLEQALSIREVGAGVQISPNGMVVLKALGLADEARAQSQAAEAVELRDGETGDLVTKIDLLAEAPKGDFALFHRADLIALLEAGARHAGVEIVLGQKISAVDLNGPSARVKFASGGSEDCEVLIGADGLHSAVRQVLNGDHKPFFTGQVAWRATLAADPGIPSVAQVYMGPGRHLVTYPLRGGHLRNIVAVEERKSWVEESWSMTDDPLALRIAFEDFVPKVSGWLNQIERPNLWGLFRHPVAAHWHGQRAVILGDAAHPTLPFLAQGANMALEDAWVLVNFMSRLPLEVAFAAYQSTRTSRVARIVAAADANARNYHLSGIRRDLAHAGLRMMSWLAPSAPAAQFRWLYRHDVTQPTALAPV